MELFFFQIMWGFVFIISYFLFRDQYLRLERDYTQECKHHDSTLEIMQQRRKDLETINQKARTYRQNFEQTKLENEQLRRTIQTQQQSLIQLQQELRNEQKEHQNSIVRLVQTQEQLSQINSLVSKE